MTATTAAPTRVPTQLALAGSAALLLAAMSAAPAWAHDTLISSTPEADEVLEASPEEIVLEFSGEGLTSGESIPNTIWVTDSEGEHWEGDTDVDGTTMSTELEEPLPNGEYEVLYHAVYSDGHSEELSFSFEVDAAAVEDDEDGPEDATAEEDGTGENGAEDAATQSPDDDAAAAEETEAADDAAEETGPEQTDGTAAETQQQFPVWTAVAFGAGVLLLIVLGAIFVRRKLKQDD